MLNAYYLGFFANMLPIVFGVAVLLLLKSIRFRGASIRVDDDIEFPPLDYSRERNLFYTIATDELIINGIAISNNALVENIALKKLSLIPYWNLKTLVKRKMANHLKVFSHGNNIQKIIQDFSPVSGMLLAHILNDSFELIYYD